MLQWDNPQSVDVGLRYKLNEEWSEFRDNFVSVQNGVLDPDAALDRDWKDAWHVGIAAPPSFTRARQRLIR